MSDVVKQGQCFLDKVIQLTGSYENALEVAFLNDMSVSDNSSLDEKSVLRKTFAVGAEILTGIATNKKVVSFFNVNNEPATAIQTKINSTPTPQGIGAMAIGTTFKIG